MNAKEITALEKGLTPAQRQLLYQKKLVGKFAPTKLVKLLKKAAIFDQHSQALCKKLRSAYRWLFGLGSVCVVVWVIVAANGGGGVALLTLLGICAALFGAGAYYNDRHGRFARGGLPKGYALDFLFPFAALMQEEAQEASKINLAADLRSPTAPAFLVGKSPKQKTYGRDFEFYRHPWLKASLTLADQSVLACEWTRLVTTIKITKRSRSGKTKVKRKVKMTDMVVLKMTAQASNYGLSGKHPPNVRAVAADSTIVVKAKAKHKSQSAFSALPIPKPSLLHTTLNTMHQMYNTLKPIAQP